jgi:hypothetical protein
MRILNEGYTGGNFCTTGRHLPSLDFAGLSALVGANATKAGIPYTCLVRSRTVPYVNAYVPVGTYGLAQAVLSCIDWRPARILIGAGEAGSMLALCGVKTTGNTNYVGLKSATALPVRGVVGEAVVLELVRLGKKRECPSLIGRNAGRPTTVVWANIFESDMIAGEVQVAGDEGALINFFANSVCVIVLVLEAISQQWLCFALVAVGMFLNATMAFLLRAQKFELPEATPAKGVPPGDSVIVLKDDPDVFCVLRCKEKAIQKLLQKEVVLNAGWVERLPLFLVSVAFMVYSALVVLGVPNMSSSAQLMFLIVVCVGSVTDLIKGSWDGKRDIAKEAIEKFGIEIKDVKKFGNRTSSVACVAARSTKLNTLKAAGLCPTTGTVWQNWWKALEIRDDEAIDKGEAQEKLNALSATIEEEDKELWMNLINDMTEGLQHATLRTT